MAGNLASIGGVHGESSRTFRVNELFRNVTAGLLASVVLIANIVSFSALMFPGQLSEGAPIAIWSMLIGSCIGGIFVAWRTTLPPIASGIDSPTGTVLVLLSAAAGSASLSSGRMPAEAIQSVMLTFSVATFVSGLSISLIGATRVASYLRFIPFFVAGGFLGAAGWFLFGGGVAMSTGIPLNPGVWEAAWSPAGKAKLSAALVTFALILIVRRFIKSAFALPALILVLCVGGTLALSQSGLQGSVKGWYLPSFGSLKAWLPLGAVKDANPEWSLLFQLMPEILAVSFVAMLTLITKISSIEVMRRTSSDFNREFTAHGLGAIAAAPLGGIVSALQIGISQLLVQTGGNRASGIFCSLFLGAVGVASFDLTAMIPMPVIAGLIFFLGYTFLVEAFSRSIAQRAWLDVVLATIIMIVCIRYGYVAGVLVGIAIACLFFVISYAQIGVIRRVATRAEYASDVDRSQETLAFLRDHGDAIRIYWLSGYIFFGSSESVFARIREDLEALPRGYRGFVILDFARVSGADSSAVLSLTKLRDYCDRVGATLVYCSLTAGNQRLLENAGFFEKGDHRFFSTLNLGLSWCEERLLERAEPRAGDTVSFHDWLQGQLGAGVKGEDLIGYLERKDLSESQVLYRGGEPADSIELVATGSLSIDFELPQEASVRLRRFTTHTLVGEMGFFWLGTRSATVSSDGPATLYSITRTNFERMRRERPDLAINFYEFIIRVLAERVEFSNRTITTLAS
jgi:SulP family sulfate permease